MKKIILMITLIFSTSVLVANPLPIESLIKEVNEYLETITVDTTLSQDEINDLFIRSTMEFDSTKLFNYIDD
jgi:hypothetical protein